MPADPTEPADASEPAAPVPAVPPPAGLPLAEPPGPFDSPDEPELAVDSLPAAPLVPPPPNALPATWDPAVDLPPHATPAAAARATKTACRKAVSKWRLLSLDMHDPMRLSAHIMQW